MFSVYPFRLQNCVYLDPNGKQQKEPVQWDLVPTAVSQDCKFVGVGLNTSTVTDGRTGVNFLRSVLAETPTQRLEAKDALTHRWVLNYPL